VFNYNSDPGSMIDTATATVSVGDRPIVAGGTRVVQRSQPRIYSAHLQVSAVVALL
jgi:hypothetical protein